MSKISDHRIMNITNRVLHILDNIEYGTEVDIHIKMRVDETDTITYTVTELAEPNIRGVNE